MFVLEPSHQDTLLLIIRDLCEETKIPGQIFNPIRDSFYFDIHYFKLTSLSTGVEISEPSRLFSREDLDDLGEKTKDLSFIESYFQPDYGFTAEYY